MCDRRSVGDVTIRDLKELLVVCGVECERDVLRFASLEIRGAKYVGFKSNGCRLAA